MKLTFGDYLFGGLRYFYSVRTIIYTIVLMLTLYWTLKWQTKYALVFAIILSIGYTVLRFLPYLKAGVKELKSQPSFTEETHWEIDNENFIRSSQSSAAKWLLHDIGKIEESPIWLYLQMKDGKFIMISKKTGRYGFCEVAFDIKG